MITITLDRNAKRTASTWLGASPEIDLPLDPWKRPLGVHAGPRRRSAQRRAQHPGNPSLGAVEAGQEQAGLLPYAVLDDIALLDLGPQGWLDLIERDTEQFLGRPEQFLAR